MRLGSALRSLSAGVGLASLAFLGACGDIDALELDVTFPSEASELRTRALRLVVREVPEGDASGCDALWGAPQPGLAQEETVTPFPNRVDLLAAAVSLDYRALSLLVYAYPGLRTLEPDDGGEPELEAVGDPILGGCVDAVIDDSTATQAVEVPLFPAP
jgi:hypothetical protein